MFHSLANLQSGLPLPLTTHLTPNKPKIIYGLYNYKATGLQDLSFKKKDRMKVLESECDWWYVEHLTSRRKGYIPSNFVTEIFLENEDWFFENISRKCAEKLILEDKTQPLGTFLIRSSEQTPNGYSLSVKDWQSDKAGYHVKHYKIAQLPNGGFYVTPHQTFDTLTELITAYSNNDNGLCCVLSKPCRKLRPIMNSILSYQDQWEISRQDIELLGKLMDKGKFGEVFYGKWKNLIEVTVKTFQEGTMSRQAFLQETEIMKRFRNKPLMIQLYGICSTGKPVYIVQEYMEKGILLKYLVQDQGKGLKFNDLCSIAFQVARGMEHLQTLEIIHRDLTARNILLGTNNVAKICNFGQARLMEDDKYWIKVKETFPIKWTALEALVEGWFTMKSDVWSYGIFLTELFTYGEMPYGEIRDNVTLVKMLKAGYRMEKPKNLPDKIYQTMLKCWHKVPEERPTFQFLSKYFKSTNVIFNEKPAKKDQSIVIQEIKPKQHKEHSNYLTLYFITIILVRLFIYIFLLF